MVSKSEFYLKNLNIRLSQNLKFGNIGIEINSINDHIEQIEEFNSEKNPVLETGVLRMMGITNQEENLKMAQSIKFLLSLAFGRNIIFDRQVYTIDNDQSTVFRKMSDPINEGIPIVPDTSLREYLTQTIPNYNSLTKDEKTTLLVAINYLNQAKNGFIEDRILRVAQSWELLAELWEISGDLDERLQQLKESLKETYKNWRKKNDVSDIDDSGRIGNKISISINQETLINKLEGLISKFQLNKSKLNLKPRELKSLRDQVAHTGRIKISGAEAHPILLASIKGLQVIILDHLGYDGHVIGHENGYRTYEKMKEFKTNPH